MTKHAKLMPSGRVDTSFGWEVKTTNHTDITAENPFEDFVTKHIEFDERGRSKTQSSHGLAKLLRMFYREVIKQEVEEALHTQREEIVKSFRDEVIGEDEDYPETSMFGHGYQDEWNKCLGRSELRAEQRQKLDKLK